MGIKLRRGLSLSFLLALKSPGVAFVKLLNLKMDEFRMKQKK